MISTETGEIHNKGTILGFGGSGGGKITGSVAHMLLENNKEMKMTNKFECFIRIRIELYTILLIFVLKVKLIVLNYQK